jgi:DNA-binding response OmpR family regulator
MDRILIVEDDPRIAELERDYLEAAGFSVEIAGDGAVGVKRALSGEFAAVVLDLMLPGLDGFNVCRRIREELQIPVLMVTARQEDIDKIRGLGLGADDFVTKPFSPSELVARVKAHLGRYRRLTESGGEGPGPAAPKKAEISFRGLRLDLRSRRAYLNGRELFLTVKEADLLQIFLENPDWVMTKDDLYRRVWGEDQYGDLSTVTVHIRKLREKIEADPGNPCYIKTVWGLGYRLAAEDKPDKR